MSGNLGARDDTPLGELLNQILDDIALAVIAATELGDANLAAQLNYVGIHATSAMKLWEYSHEEK